MTILRNGPFSENIIDVLMLCTKFELIPANNFGYMSILMNEPNFQNKAKDRR